MSESTKALLFLAATQHVCFTSFWCCCVFIIIFVSEAKPKDQRTSTVNSSVKLSQIKHCCMVCGKLFKDSGALKQHASDKKHYSTAPSPTASQINKTVLKTARSPKTVASKTSEATQTQTNKLANDSNTGTRLLCLLYGSTWFPGSICNVSIKTRANGLV